MNDKEWVPDTQFEIYCKVKLEVKPYILHDHRNL